MDSFNRLSFLAKCFVKSSTLCISMYHCFIILKLDGQISRQFGHELFSLLVVPSSGRPMRTGGVEGILFTFRRAAKHLTHCIQGENIYQNLYVTCAQKIYIHMHIFLLVLFRLKKTKKTFDNAFFRSNLHVFSSLFFRESLTDFEWPPCVQDIIVIGLELVEVTGLTLEDGTNITDYTYQVYSITHLEIERSNRVNTHGPLIQSPYAHQ